MLAMFKGYFDESDTKGAAVVAGCVGHFDQWKRFEPKWGRLLLDYKIQGGFHMKEFVSRRYQPNQYSAWDDANCREFFDRLVRIIGHHTTISFGVALDQEVFDAFKRTPEGRLFGESKYETASWVCLILVDRWARKRKDLHRIDFVFDRGNRRRTALEKSYNHAYQGREYFGGLTFEDDEKFFPLQAADFVAYEISKAWTSHRIDQRIPRETFRLASQLIKHEWRVDGSAHILQALARTQRESQRTET